MQRGSKKLRLIKGGYHSLEELHDQVMGYLETTEKKGIRELLQKNNESCKKLLYPYIKFSQNKSAAMTALAAILEAHSRECYAIGYIDSSINGKLEAASENANQDRDKKPV